MIMRLCESVIIFILLTFCGLQISKTEKVQALLLGFAYQALRSRHIKPIKPYLHEIIMIMNPLQNFLDCGCGENI